MLNPNDIKGRILVSRHHTERTRNAKFIFVLVGACLELIHIGHGEHDIVQGQIHKKSLLKTDPNRVIEDCRPDIVYHCLLQLQESALNKLGLISVYVQTQTNELISVSPIWKLPESFSDFKDVIACLLINRVVYDTSGKNVLLSIVKNDLSLYFAPDTVKIGFEYDEKNTDLKQLLSDNLSVLEESDDPTLLSCMSNIHHKLFCKFKKNTKPLAFFIGCIAKGKYTDYIQNDITEYKISLGDYHLSAAECCNQIIYHLETILFSIK